MEDFASQNLGLNTLKNGTRPMCQKNSNNRLELDEQQLKPYFLWKWLAGVFDIANKLYGLRFEKQCP